MTRRLKLWAFTLLGAVAFIVGALLAPFIMAYEVMKAKLK